MQDDKLRGGLGSKFEGFGAAPSEGLWDAISDSLDGKKKKRRGIIWWFTGAGIAAVGLIAVLLYYKGANRDLAATNRPNETERALEHTNGNETLNELELTPKGMLGMTSLAEMRSAHLSVEISTASSGNEGNRTEGAGAMEERPEGGFLADGGPGVDTASSQEDKEEIINLKGDVLALPLADLSEIETEGLVNLMVTLDPIENKVSKWEMGLGVNHYNTLPTFKKQYELVSFSDAPTTTDGDSTLYDVGIESAPSNILNIRASKPVGIKFYLGYELNKRLRATSGLLVEYTRYQIVNVNDEFSGNSIEQLPYYPEPAIIGSVGVPLGLEFDFISKRRFKMGLGTGVLNEFPILERYQQNGSAAIASAEKSSGLISGYNFGMNFNLSAAYYLNEKFRVQFNPSIRWYLYQRTKASISVPDRSGWGGGLVSLIWKLD